MKYFFVILSILFQSFSFIFSKLASENSIDGDLISYVLNVFYLSSLICLVFQAFFWQKALEKLALSKAYPYTGGIYVLILIYSYFFFGEPIYLNNIIGVSVIFLGIYIISLEDAI
ncbi:EamA family transporter [Solibacillus silvestris]